MGSLKPLLPYRVQLPAPSQTLGWANCNGCTIIPAKWSQERLLVGAGVAGLKLATIDDPLVAVCRKRVSEWVSPRIGDHESLFEGQVVMPDPSGRIDDWEPVEQTVGSGPEL